MNLFPEVDATALPAIPGLAYRPEYITPIVETALVAAIDAEPWDTTWRRRRQPYGKSYSATSGNSRAIPPWAEFLIERFYTERIGDQKFDQMLVNEYLPGQGIAFHRDYEPFDRTVLSLSLLSPCVMEFRQEGNDNQESILLQPRSLLILSDEARYDWQHGIAPRKTDLWQGEKIKRSRRLSVTFRRRVR